MTINRTHLAGLGIAIEQVEDATDMTELFYCLKDLIAEVQSAPEAEPVEVVAIDWPEYHYEAMGCGLEDRGITDRYEAMQHGWDCAMERCAEQLPDEPLMTVAQHNRIMASAPQHDAGWREHSKQYAKGEKCPETIETLQAAWDRDQELMMGQKAEISRLKEKLNRAEQRNKPHDAELVELLAAMRSFTLEHDSGIGGVLRGKIDAKLATLKVKP